MAQRETLHLFEKDPKMPLQNKDATIILSYPEKYIASVLVKGSRLESTSRILCDGILAVRCDKLNSESYSTPQVQRTR